jgi:Tfp pilus assembly protein PilV
MNYEKNKNNFSLQPSAFSVQRGFTLMEAIVAIFVIITGIVGVMTLITFTITSAQISKDKLIAAYLAQEGIEIVRNIRDTNWLEQYTNPNPWDEGLSVAECSGTCDEAINGCRVDYTYSEQPDPSLPAYTGQYLNIDGNGYYSYLAGTQTKFKRKIVITPGVDILEVCSRVEWEEKGRIHQVTVKEILYNWK